jgi:hypothetical protein
LKLPPLGEDSINLKISSTMPKDAVNINGEYQWQTIEIYYRLGQLMCEEEALSTTFFSLLF